MVKILSSRNNKNNRIRKDSKDPNKNSKKLFLKLILLLLSMPKDLAVCRNKQNLWRRFMLSGVFTDLLSNTIIFWNGWELKLELLWDMKLKNQMHGWMVSNLQPDLDFKSYFLISSMTISTNSCLKTSYIQLSLSSNVIQSLLQVDKSQFQVNQF